MAQWLVKTAKAVVNTYIIEADSKGAAMDIIRSGIPMPEETEDHYERVMSIEDVSAPAKHKT